MRSPAARRRRGACGRHDVLHPKAACGSAVCQAASGKGRLDSAKTLALGCAAVGKEQKHLPMNLHPSTVPDDMYGPRWPAKLRGLTERGEFVRGTPMRAVPR